MPEVYYTSQRAPEEEQGKGKAIRESESESETMTTPNKYFVRIRRMSPKTNQIDLSAKAREYLIRLGMYDQHKKVGDLEIWCRYESNKCTKVGPTEESVTPTYKE